MAVEAADFAVGDEAMVKQRIVWELELPDGGEVESLDEAEELAMRAAKRVHEQVLQRLADERAAELRSCPECSSEQVQGRGRRPRVLHTALGEVQLSRQRCVCRRCGRSFFPSGGELGDT